jgi:catechol 2,3-dioxygenase
VGDLVAAVASEELPEHADRDLGVGHLHMHVGSVADALAFYRDLAGFEVMTDFGSAAFVAAGGYHHHLGLNVWKGEGVPPNPPDAVGLEHWTVIVGDDEPRAAAAQMAPDTSAYA